MQITFRNTVTDFEALAKAFPFWQRVWWRFRLLWFILICATPGTIVLALLGMWRGLLMSWAIISLVLVAAVWHWLVNRRRHHASFEKVSAEDRTIRLTPDALEGESKLGWSRRCWSAVHRIHTTAEHILIFVGKLTAIVIPKRAFESSLAADNFAHELERSLKQAVGPKTAFVAKQSTERLAAQEMPVAAVEYQNTREELVTVQYEGLADSPTSDRTGSFVAWMMALTIATLMILFASQVDGMAAEIIAGAFGFFVMLIVFAVTLFGIERRRSLGHVDDEALLPRKVVISPKGIASIRNAMEEFQQWSVFGGIEDSDRFIAVYFVKPQIGYLIPKSAFDSADAAEQLLQSAKTYFEEARVKEEPESEQFETGNPYQPPLAQ